MSRDMLNHVLGLIQHPSFVVGILTLNSQSSEHRDYPLSWCCWDYSNGSACTFRSDRKCYSLPTLTFPANGADTCRTVSSERPCYHLGIVPETNMIRINSFINHHNLYSTFKFFRNEMSEMIPMLFSDRFKYSRLVLVFRCSIVLMLFPSRLRCVKWTKSFSPSMVKIPL